MTSRRGPCRMPSLYLKGLGQSLTKGDWWRFLGAERSWEPKEEMGYKRWTCRRKTCQACAEQRQKGEPGRPKQGAGKQTIPAPVSCVQSSPVRSTGPLPQPQKMLPEVHCRGGSCTSEKTPFKDGTCLSFIPLTPSWSDTTSQPWALQKVSSN